MQYFILLPAIARQICTIAYWRRDSLGESWEKCLAGSFPYAHSGRVASTYAQPADPCFMLLQKHLILASSALLLSYEETFLQTMRDAT